MSFEDHIKKHKKDLELKEIDPMIWEAIETQLPEKPIARIHPMSYWMMAASVAILLVSGYIFFQNSQQNQILDETQNQVIALREEVNALLNEQSSFSRIKAVNLTNQLESADPEIIRALLYTIQNDNSKNVRLAALKAIEQFANEETVKAALINTLKSSEEPFVQIRIINILSKIKAKNALPLLEDLIQKEGTVPYVREEAETAKSNIKSI